MKIKSIDRLIKRIDKKLEEMRERALADEITEEWNQWFGPAALTNARTSERTYHSAEYGFLDVEPDPQELLDKGFYNHVDGSYLIIERNEEEDI